ncbi:hypothetical protein Tco_0318361 [Tanacetum coccineum]
MGVLRLEKNGVMIRLKVGKGSAKVLVQEYMILSSLALDITDLPADLLNIQEEFIRILFGLGSGIIHREVYVGLFFEEVFLGMRGIHGKFGQVFRLGEVFKSGNLFPDVLGRSLVRNVCREVCFWEVYGAYSGNKGLWESFGILRCVTAESLLGLVVIYVEGKRRKCITREFNWLLLPICWVVALCGLTLGMSCWECREWSFSGNWEFFPKCGISEGKCLGGKDIRDPLALSFHSGDGSLRDGRGCLGIFTSGKDPYAGWDIGGVNDGKQCWSDAIGSFQCLYDREVVTLGNGEGTGGYGQFWGFKGCADYGGKQSVVLGCGLPGIFSGNLIVGTRGDNMGSFIVLDVRLPLVSEGIDVLSGTREIGILVSYGSGKFRDVVLCYGEEIGYLRSFGNGEDWLVWVSGEIGGKDMAVGVLGYGRGMFRGVWGGKVGSVKLVIVRDVDVFHEDLLDILRNSDVALCYGESGLTVKGYVDSDYAGDLDRSKSTIGVPCILQGIQHFIQNTKHIRVQYHFIREKVEEGPWWDKRKNSLQKRKQHESARKDNGVKIDLASIESSSGRLLYKLASRKGVYKLHCEVGSQVQELVGYYFQAHELLTNMHACIWRNVEHGIEAYGVCFVIPIRRKRAGVARFISFKERRTWCSPFSSVKGTVVPFIFSGMISFGEGWGELFG